MGNAIWLMYIASFSGGKDSTAMVLRLMEEKRPLDRVIFFDTQMEFDCVYGVVEEVKKRCIQNGVEFITLRSEENAWLTMLARPVKDHYGYEWCGGPCRWGTTSKIASIARYVSEGDIEYIGIAADERERMKNKCYPLIVWNMTEADCLTYCHEHGIFWMEGDTELYSVLDRVSCWCCTNKNLKELRAMYHHLPKYWGYLKGLQSRMARPFKKNCSIFDLEERFRREDEQLELF